jgi:hypothetical protein
MQSANSNDDQYDNNIIELLDSKNLEVDLKNLLVKLKLSPKITDYLSRALMEKKTNKKTLDEVSEYLKITSKAADRSKSIIHEIKKKESELLKSVPLN